MFRRSVLLALCLGLLALQVPLHAADCPDPNVTPTPEDPNLPDDEMTLPTYTLNVYTNLRAGDMVVGSTLPVPSEVYAAEKSAEPAALARARSSYVVTKGGQRVYATLTQHFDNPDPNETVVASGSARLHVYVRAGTIDPNSAAVTIQRYQFVTAPTDPNGYFTFDPNSQQAPTSYSRLDTETTVVNFDGQPGQWITVPIYSAGQLQGAGQMTVQATTVLTLDDCGPKEEQNDPNDDEVDPNQVKDPCADVKPDKGDGLHMHLTTGAIWTQVPILQLFAEDEQELNLTLRYDSGVRSWSMPGTEELRYEYADPPGLPVGMIYTDATGRRHHFTSPVYNGQLFMAATAPIGRGAMMLTLDGDMDSGVFKIRFPDGQERKFRAYEFGNANLRYHSPIVQSTDARGRVTDYGRSGDAEGRLTSITTPHGRQVTFGYDTVNHRRFITGPGNKVTTLTYNTAGDLISIADPDAATEPNAHTQRFEYDDDHRLVSETLKNGVEYTASYCALRDGIPDPNDPNERSIQDGDGNVIVRVQSPLGFPDLRSDVIEPGIVTLTDGRGVVSTLQRDNLGRLVEIVGADGNMRIYEYGDADATYSRNRIISIRNERGERRYYQYDGNGSITSQQDEAGHTASFQYSTARPYQLTQRTEPGGRVWTYRYNDAGDPNEITDPLDDTPAVGQDRKIRITYTYYDPNDGLTNKPGRISRKTITDRNNHVTQYDYDVYGNLTTVTHDPGDLALVTEFTYDDYGRPLTKTVHRDATTSSSMASTYDGMGRLVTVRERLTADPNDDLVTTCTYDGHGNLTTLTDPNGVQTTFSYDNRNFLIGMVQDPSGLQRTTSWVVDGEGNVLELRTPDGGVTQYQYNDAGYLTQVTDAGGYVTELVPDPVGMVTKLTRHLDPADPNDPVYVEEFVYDAINRLIAKTIDPGAGHVDATTLYEYTTTSGCGCDTGSSRPNKIKDATDKVTKIEYDALNRPTQLIRKIGDPNAPTDPNDAITTFTYDPMGNLTAVVGPEGEQVTFVYDAANRRTEAHAILATNPPDSLDFYYQYDGAGNVIGLTRPEGSQITLQYDQANRLTRALDDANKVLTELTYDPTGNVLSRASGLRDGNDPTPIQVWNYRYDILGRVTQVFEPNDATLSNPIVTTYDDANRRVDVQDRLGRKTRREFDQLGRLIHLIENYRTSGGDSTANTTTTYGYNGARQVSLTDSDNHVTQYFYDTALRLATVNYPDHPGSATGQVNYTRDTVGRVLTRTDQRGVETTYTYDDLGNLATRSYGWTGHTPRSENFWFNRSGKLMRAYDSLYGDLYFGYDPLGRLTSTEQDYLDALDPVWYIMSYGYALDTTNHKTERTLTYPSSRVVTATFDSHSRLEEVTGGPRIGSHWTFDDANRRTSATLGNGAASAFDYDLNNRLTQIRHAKDATLVDPFYNVEQGYDVVGNLLWKRDNVVADRSMAYTYDERNRLKSFARGVLYADPTQGVETPTTSPVLPNQQNWVNLDSRGNWLGLNTTINTTASTETRTLAAVGGAANEYNQLNLTTGSGNPNSERLTYDAAGNLVEINLLADGNCDGAVNWRDIDYMLAAQNDNESAWLALFGSSTPGCPFSNLDTDGDGHVNWHDIDPLIAHMNTVLPDASRFEYDEENRLVAVKRIDGTPLLTIKYDALGRRVETADYQAGCESGVPLRTRHIMAGLETIEEYEVCGATSYTCDNSCWPLAREFIWGASFTEPIAVVDHTSAGDVAAGTPEVLHYVHDAQGSVVGLLDAGDPDATPDPIPPQMVERYTYDPYGTTYIETWNSGTGTWIAAANGRSKYGNPFMWTGQRYDAGVKLYHFPFRTYSPQIGRWLQRDPAGYVDGVNLYQYVMSMPTGFIDPLGLRPLTPCEQAIIDKLKKLADEAEAKATEESKKAAEKLRKLAEDLRKWIDSVIAHDPTWLQRTLTALIKWESDDARYKTKNVTPANDVFDEVGADKYKCNRFVGDVLWDANGIDTSRGTFTDTPPSANSFADGTAAKDGDKVGVYGLQYFQTTDQQNLRPGDVLAGKGDPGHVGLYIGDGLYVSATDHNMTSIPAQNGDTGVQIKDASRMASSSGQYDVTRPHKNPPRPLSPYPNPP